MYTCKQMSKIFINIRENVNDGTNRQVDKCVSKLKIFETRMIKE